MRDINLEIKKGSRLGISGVTGGGKSTLLDLIMGLHLPSNGNIYIDDVPLNKMNQRAWQLNIAHVPQNIFIADTTIAENIAFGLAKKEIDIDRVRIAAKQACIDDTISAWKDGYDTRVGERGIWLSGGQRQRIGIARALYKNSSLLILDEATSALDYETESRVMNSIRELSPNLTILMVAHRLTTLNGCDAIIKLENGQFFIESTNP
jgi:ABC-type multidrug transport system fused ATPase/permease subunit